MNGGHALIRDNATHAIRTSDGTLIQVGSAIPATSEAQLTPVVPSGAVDGANAVFTIDPSPIGRPLSSSNCLVFVNGVLQLEGTDFTFTDAVTITFSSPPTAGAAVNAVLLGTPAPPTVTPPTGPPTGAGNILSNGDFSSGSAGWSKTPPAYWETFPWVHESHEVDFDPSSARVYLGQRTNRTVYGDSGAGLVYTGSEWTPDRFSNWLIAFEWRRIAEIETNNAPYGLPLTAPLGLYWGERDWVPSGPGGSGGFWFPTSAGAALDWQKVGIVVTVENTVPGGAAEWQFAITSDGAWCAPAAGVSNTTYGFAFEVRNVSLSPYNG